MFTGLEWVIVQDRSMLIASNIFLVFFKLYTLHIVILYFHFPIIPRRKGGDWNKTGETATQKGEELGPSYPAVTELD